MPRSDVPRLGWATRFIDVTHFGVANTEMKPADAVLVSDWRHFPRLAHSLGQNEQCQVF